MAGGGIVTDGERKLVEERASDRVDGMVVEGGGGGGDDEGAWWVEAVGRASRGKRGLVESRDEAYWSSAAFTLRAV